MYTCLQRCSSCSCTSPKVFVITLLLKHRPLVIQSLFFCALSACLLLYLVPLFDIPGTRVAAGGRPPAAANSPLYLHIYVWLYMACKHPSGERLGTLVEPPMPFAKLRHIIRSTGPKRAVGNECLVYTYESKHELDPRGHTSGVGLTLLPVE